MTEEHRQTETNKCVRMNSTNYEALNLNSTHYKGCKKVIRKFFLHFHFFLVKGNKLEMICAQTHPQTDWRWGEGSARERDVCRYKHKRHCCSVRLRCCTAVTCRSAVAGAAGTRSTTEQIHWGPRSCSAWNQPSADSRLWKTTFIHRQSFTVSP